MGFNIAGVVIDKHYATIEELNADIEWTLKKESEIIFEEAMSNWKEDHLFDVYLGSHGTLIMMSAGMVLDKGIYLKKGRSLKFIIVEFAMSFYLEYSHDNQCIFTLMDNQGSNKKGAIITGDASILNSFDQTDTSNMIFALIHQLVGQNAGIDPASPSIRCTN